MTELVLVGHIRDAFGIKGWVEIQPYSEEPVGLLTVKHWQLKRGADARTVEVEQAKPHSGKVVAKLAAVPDRSAAESYKGFEIWVAKQDLPPPKDDEFYLADLIGCRVENSHGVWLGDVQQVDDNGAHGFMTVRGAGKAEHLIPFVSAYVLNVDVPAKRIVVEWQEEFSQ
jgi:16S rRNA processing protein RimM